MVKDSGKWPRLRHAYDLGIGWWAVLVGVWSVLSFVDTLIGKLASKEFQAKWVALWLHPVWGWKTWLVGVCVITTIVIFEGSYRKARRQEQNHRKELAEESAKRDRAFSQMVAKKDADYAAIVSMKDGELRNAKIQSAEAYRHMENTKEKEREAVERTLKGYTVVWRELQSKAHELAIGLREYAELTGTDPTPPLIAGESESDFDVRKMKLMQPWMDKVTYEYNKTFGDRVQGIRDEFAMLGYRDSKLDYRIDTAVVHTDQVMEIADRLMGLALNELAKRQLRTLTLKQLCCG